MVVLLAQKVDIAGFVMDIFIDNVGFDIIPRLMAFFGILKTQIM